MGSKRLMLQNGLGTLIKEEAPKYKRFIDLFSGGSFVSWYAAEQIKKPVISIDLQKYSKVLANSVISRTSKINLNIVIANWVKKTENAYRRSKVYKEAKILEPKKFTKKRVLELRAFCQTKSSVGPILKAYGGHYFSPSQALIFDFLLKYLPKHSPHKTICLSALIMTASKCVAAPGHTAQPFQPTKSAKKFIDEAWNRDIISILKTELKTINSKQANIKGHAYINDAYKFASKLTSTDLVFIDPPYSGVQYSRFYHVLETIARGVINSEVDGVGRYPDIKERPQSKFSNIGESRDALDKLLKRISEKKASVILTFPTGKASNGLSGRKVQNISRKWFDIERRKVYGKFSTLGGNNEIREARKKGGELILLLKPRIIKNGK